MSQNMLAGFANPLADRSRRFGRAISATLVAAIVLTFDLHVVGAQESYNIGPRSLYGARKPTNHDNLPLVMQDAIQSLVVGRRLLAVGPRIVGGMLAPTGVYPWIASIQVRRAPSSAGHFCGGAFISAHWVITAAHCVHKDSASKIQIVGGSNRLDQGGTTYFVDRIVVHEKWDADTQEYDVALLHLERPFTGRAIAVITPADAGRLAAPGVLGIVAGWGLTAEGGRVSNALRHVTVQLVSNKDCNGLASYGGAITDLMMCAGFAEGGKDSCQGDSGGPLIVPDMNGGYVQTGVVSFGEGCARPGKYGVYARLPVLQPWVASKIGRMIATATAPQVSNQSPSSDNRTLTAPAAAAPPREARSVPARMIPNGWGWKPAAPR